MTCLCRTAFLQTARAELNVDPFAFVFAGSERFDRCGNRLDRGAAVPEDLTGRKMELRGNGDDLHSFGVATLNDPAQAWVGVRERAVDHAEHRVPSGLGPKHLTEAPSERVALDDRRLPELGEKAANLGVRSKHRPNLIGAYPSAARRVRSIKSFSTATHRMLMFPR